MRRGRGGTFHRAASGRGEPIEETMGLRTRCLHRWWGVPVDCGGRAGFRAGHGGRRPVMLDAGLPDSSRCNDLAGWSRPLHACSRPSTTGWPSKEPRRDWLADIVAMGRGRRVHRGADARRSSIEAQGARHPARGAGARRSPARGTGRGPARDAGTQPSSRRRTQPSSRHRTQLSSRCKTQLSSRRRHRVQPNRGRRRSPIEAQDVAQSRRNCSRSRRGAAVRRKPMYRASGSRHARDAEGWCG